MEHSIKGIEDIADINSDITQSADMIALKCVAEGIIRMDLSASEQSALQHFLTKLSKYDDVRQKLDHLKEKENLSAWDYSNRQNYQAQMMKVSRELSELAYGRALCDVTRKARIELTLMETVESVPSAPRAAAAEQTQDQKSDRGELLFCHKCGQKLLPGSRFCNKCGASIPFASGVIQRGSGKEKAPAPTTAAQRDVRTAAVYERPVEKEKRKPISITPRFWRIAAAVLAAVLIIGYFTSYFLSSGAAGNRDFQTADNLLLIPALTRIHDPKLEAYIDAGLLFESGSFSEAHDRFAKLEGYKEAYTLELESSYQLAAVSVENHDFSTALVIYRQLAEISYKDSQDLIPDTICKNAEHLTLEEKDYKSAKAMLKPLCMEGNENAIDLWAEATREAVSQIAEKDILTAYRTLLQEKYSAKDFIGNRLDDEMLRRTAAMYNKAVALYRDNDFSKAVLYFSTLEKPYKSSEKYIKISAILDNAHGVSQADLAYLKSNISFDGVKSALMMNNELGFGFLEGQWKSADGYYYLNYSSEEHMVYYNLPDINYGNKLKIVNGVMKSFPEGKESTARDLFKIMVLDTNKIYVYCCKDSRVYTLIRQ